MNIQTIQTETGPVAVIRAEETLLLDTRSALELLRAATAVAGTVRVALPKSAVTESFFISGTGLADEVRRKLLAAGGALAIYGDYSRYYNSPMQDFMYKSNALGGMYFTATLDEAIRKLAT